MGKLALSKGAVEYSARHSRLASVTASCIALEAPSLACVCLLPTVLQPRQRTGRREGEAPFSRSLHASFARRQGGLGRRDRDRRFTTDEDVVAHFPNVRIGFTGSMRLSFIPENFFQAGLRSLDTRGEDGFPPHVGGDQDVWIGKVSSQPGELAQRGVRMGQSQDHLRRVLEFRRERRRSKRQMGACR